MSELTEEQIANLLRAAGWTIDTADDVKIAIEHVEMGAMSWTLTEALEHPATVLTLLKGLADGHEVNVFYDTEAEVWCLNTKRGNFSAIVEGKELGEAICKARLFFEESDDE